MPNNTHCFHGAGDDAEFGSDEWAEARIKYPEGATCLLPAGHDGPHEYTPDTEWGVTFAAGPKE